MNPSEEKGGEYYRSSSQPEVHHNGASGLEVVPPQVPEYHNSKPDRDEKISYKQERMPERRRVCGITPLMFWILIFTIVILLAAGVGAGLGAGLSKKSTDKTTADPSTSSTPSIHPKTSSSSTSSPTAAVAAAHAESTSSPSTSSDVTCPSNDSLVYTPPSRTQSSTAYNLNATTLTYTIHCNQTYYASTDITDVQYIPNSNLSSCIQACSIYNTQAPNGGGDDGFWNLCSGVTVTVEGICEIKQGVLNDSIGANRTGGPGQSAKLLWYPDD